GSLLLITILAPSVIGCGGSSGSQTSGPVTFREDVELLIEAQNYRGAVALLASADPAHLASHDETGYSAVGEDMIVLPGVDPKILYDENRDWLFPGTSDVIEDMKWQRAATEFARRYNEFREEK